MKKKTTISFIGDVMLGRKVGQKIKCHGYKYPFAEVYKILKSADITFANLESPISDAKQSRLKKRITFTAPIDAIKSLKYSGIDIVSLANNHILDYYQEAMFDTLKYLQKYKIKNVGLRYQNRIWRGLPIKQYEVIKKNGIKFGFLAYTAIVPAGFTANNDQPGVEPTIFFKYLAADEIRELKKRADVVIVSIHMGREYKKSPIDYQKNYARIAIRAGADVVVGHHSHVLAEVEKYKGGLIFYSLGNFIFDQNPSWRKGVDKSIIVEVEFKGKEILTYKTIPIEIKNCQPRVIKAKKQ